MSKQKETLDSKYDRLLTYENEAECKGYTIYAGIDEAGRGPLAGPVVAAACILSKEDRILGLDDSKKLSEKKRNELYEEIVRRSVAFSIVRIENHVIDQINILEATKLAMRECVAQLAVKPDLLLIDAVDLKGVSMTVFPIIKGDALSNSIAAASVLAKVYRDRIMLDYDKIYPGYGFAQHKGYGTKAHYEAIAKLSITPIHRKTFLKNINY